MIYLKSLVSVARKPALTLTLLPLLILSGCQKAPDAQQQKAAQAAPTPKPEPEAHIFVDEAMLARPYAIIGGSVQNVGNENLEKLSVEIELRRRADSGVETREIKVEPADLVPGQQGKFSLKVLSEEWSGSRVVGLKSGARAEEVAFKSMPGAKRPPEKMKDNVIIVKTPAKKRSGGDDFINTPDNPYSVP
ncbi:MAG: hypothetical protein QOH49_3523 [Acidobacteriota bacterium]|jgi:hypothetical protein|nr:hypothetical protein [Acidobacteriota bacterium]